MIICGRIIELSCEYNFSVYILYGVLLIAILNIALHIEMKKSSKYRDILYCFKMAVSKKKNVNDKEEHFFINIFLMYETYIAN